MSGEGFQCPFRHRVYSKRCGETPDIENIRCFGIFGSCARPQETLRTCAKVVDTRPTRRAEKSAHCLVCTFSDGDAQSIVQLFRCLARNGSVPATDEERCHRADIRVEAGVNPTFDSAQKCLGSREIMLTGKQESDIDRYSGKDCFLDRGKALFCPGNLDKYVRPSRTRKKIFGLGNSAGCIVCE